MMRSEYLSWAPAILAWAGLVFAAPVAAQNQPAHAAKAAKKRASADITARLQAQAIEQAAQRAQQRNQQLDQQRAETSTPPKAHQTPAPVAAVPSTVAVPSVASAQLDGPTDVPSWPVDKPLSPDMPAAAALAPPAGHVLLPAAHRHSATSENTSPELAIAQHIHQGLMRCELGASVRVEADPARPGYFFVRGNGFRYRMHPVPTSTGALRLEDKKAGAVWLQLANKSMLMDQKKGRRVADECAHPDQVAFVKATQNQPPVDLFDTAGMGRPLD